MASADASFQFKTSYTATREFQAPEIFAGGNTMCKKNIDEYSVGVVMYYLLTGHYPFKILEKAKTDLEAHQYLISQDLSFELPAFQNLAHFSDLQ